MTSSDVSVSIEKRLLGMLEWHSLESGREISDAIRECIESKLLSQPESLWISKRLGPVRKILISINAITLQKEACSALA